MIHYHHIGFFTTPTDIDTIKASTTGDNKVDTVANAVKNVWNGSGFAESMFGVNNNNSGTLAYSIMTDEQQLFLLYRQIEKYWSFKFKQKFKNNFKFELLNLTWFNLENMINFYLKQAQFSIPIGIVLPLLLGFEITDIDDMASMQEEIFDVFNKWKPLMSSNTTAGNLTKDAGSPEKQNKTNSGDQTSETDQNNKR
jgi:hypothetical protein